MAGRTGPQALASEVQAKEDALSWPGIYEICASVSQILGPRGGSVGGGGGSGATDAVV